MLLTNESIYPGDCYICTAGETELAIQQCADDEQNYLLMSFINDNGKNIGFEIVNERIDGLAGLLKNEANLHHVSEGEEVFLRSIHFFGEVHILVKSREIVIHASFSPQQLNDAVAFMYGDR